MATLPKLPLPLAKDGIVREAVIDETLVPESTVQFAMNLNFDRIGAVQLRPGLTLLGNQITASTPVLGMGFYRNNAGDTFRVLAKVGNDVYAYDGSSWGSVRGSLGSNSKARFANFIDLTYMVNGNNAQALQTYNGTTFGTSNVGDLPKGDVIEQYRSRVWVGDSSTDKLYYTDVVTTSNTITGGSSFIQISPQDGEKITALKRHPRALLVFKQNHIYRVFNINSTDPDPSIFRGTYSQESVVDGKSGIFYHHPTGFYRFVFSGEQQEISRPIIDIVNAIPRSYYENVSGWEEEDGDHICWSIGDITLNGVSFSNVVCRYTISTQVWTIYSYGSEIRSSVLYDDGSSLYRLVGDDDGNVLQFNTGADDNGSRIFYDLQTHWIYFTNIKSNKKSMTELATLHENATGANLQYQLDTDRPNKWRDMGTIREDLYDIQSLNANDFTRIRFRLFGDASGDPFIFRGFEALNLITDGVIKE